MTADRDEKIRVNHYPRTFDIHQFLLGHQEYVSKIVLSNNVVVTGGGDPYLLFWDYLQGKALHKLDLLEGTDLPAETQFNVIALGAFQERLLVAFENLNVVLVYDASRKLKQKLTVPGSVLDACFDAKGNLCVTGWSEEPFIQYYEYRKEYQLSRLDLIDQVLETSTKQVEQGHDFYEIGKMRKWSNWRPSEDRKRVPDTYPENKPKKKRGGKKQREKKKLEATEALQNEAVVE